MFAKIKKWLGISDGPDYKEMMRKGAVILDVRTRGEYTSGHIDKSVNIPLDQLSNQLGKLKDKNKPVICCCASGMRSGTAARFLKSHGFTNVYNGGGWMSLQRKI